MRLGQSSFAPLEVPEETGATYWSGYNYEDEDLHHRIMDEEGEEEDEDIKDWQTLRTTLMIYIPLFLVFTIIYSFVRKRFPKVYNVRHEVDRIRCTLAEDQLDTRTWMYTVLKIPERELIDECGLDGVCLFRILRVGLQLSLAGCLCALFLVPTYATAKHSDSDTTDEDAASNATSSEDDRWEQTTAAALPEGSERYYATVTAAYVLFFYAMHLILHEFAWFTQARTHFRSRLEERSYTVYVSGIPVEYRSDEALAEFFRRAGSDSVLQAAMVLHLPLLDKCMEQRAALQKQLAHARAQAQADGVDEASISHWNVSTAEYVPTVDYCTKELEQNFNEIQELMRIVRVNQATTKKASKTALKATFQLMGLGLKQLPSALCSSMHEEDHAVSSQELLSTKDKNDDKVAFGEELPKEGCDVLQEEEKNAPYDEVPVSSTNGTLTKHKATTVTQEENDSSSLVPAGPSPSLMVGDIAPLKKSPSSLSEEVDIEVTMSGNIMDPEDAKHDETTSTKRSVYFDASASRATDVETDSETGALLGADDKEAEEGEKRFGFSSLSKMHSKAKHRLSKLRFDNLKLPSMTLVQNRTAGQLEKLLSRATSERGIRRLKPLSKEELEDIVDKAASLMGIASRDDEGKPDSAGFVTFTSLAAANTALQLVHSKIPSKMSMKEAPPPDTIFWKNVGLTPHAIQVGTLIATAMTTALIIFWTIPVTAIASLADAENWAIMDDVQNSPFLVAVLKQIAPLTLTVLNAIVLPMILKRISRHDGDIGISYLESSVFRKLAAFQVRLFSCSSSCLLWIEHVELFSPCRLMQLFQTFLVATLSRSITSALRDLIDPKALFRHLATKLPPQSIFFIQYVLIGTVIGVGTEMIRVTALVQATLRKFIGPRLTEEERDTPFLCFRPLSNPRYFLYAIVLGKITLFFMILFTYATLSPLVCVVMAFAFAVSEVCYRHQHIYIYPVLDSGGQLWFQFIFILEGMIVFSEGILMSYLVIRRASGPSAMMIPLIVVTGVFIVYLHQRHVRVARYLSSEDCVRADIRNDLNRTTALKLFGDKYLQPSFVAATSDEFLDTIAEGTDNSITEEDLENKENGARTTLPSSEGSLQSY